MNRFVRVKDDYSEMVLNTRAIVGLMDPVEDKVTLELYDGTTYRIDRDCLPEVTGDHTIVQIIPCEGIRAMYGDHEDTKEYADISYMAVTASGLRRPLDEVFHFMDEPREDGLVYQGLCPDKR